MSTQQQTIERRALAWFASHDTGISSMTIARHMLGLRHGLPGARRWRQVWSDHRLKGLHPAQVAAMARGEDLTVAI